MNKRAGFTLIEISIVVVVIGLIIGGISYGTSMIKNARLNAVVTEVAQYQQAFKDFQDRYHALPGDMYNATDTWGTDAGGCPATTYTATAHITTCNGNGDGQIGMGSGTYYELFRAWQQLANAQMIKGQFNGIKGTGGSGYEAIVGVNVPASRMIGSGYTLFNSLATIPGSNWTTTGHVLVFGAAISNDITRGASLSPVDAMNIDSKLDDGLPGYGKVLTQRLSNCVTNTADPALSKYNSTNAGEVCNLIFTLGF